MFYWDLVESDKVVTSFKAHGGVVTSMAMHPDGQLLLTSSVDGAVKVWGKTAAGAEAEGEEGEDED